MPERLVKNSPPSFSRKPEKASKRKSCDARCAYEKPANLLRAEIEVRIKKQVKRNGRREDMGEIAIQFASMDELNALIDRLRGQSFVK